jgi:uncharacterized protein YkwD
MSLNPAAIVAKINNVRRQHSAPPVAWDDKLARAAQEWADRKTYAHSPDRTYGENLAKVWSCEADMATAIRMWEAEMQYYDPAKPEFSSKTGHYTQLVWKATNKIGAAIARLNDGSYLYVLKFSPAGNIRDPNAFRQNVTK